VLKIGDKIIVTRDDIEPELVGQVGTITEFNSKGSKYPYKIEEERTGRLNWVEDVVIATPLMKALA
jgi:hypothetical protein